MTSDGMEQQRIDIIPTETTQSIQSAIAELEYRKLKTIYHVNAHKVYLFHKIPPQGLALKKNVSTGFDTENTNTKVEKFLNKSALTLTSIVQKVFEKKLHNLYDKLDKKYKRLHSLCDNATFNAAIDTVNNHLSTHSKLMYCKTVKKISRDIPNHQPLLIGKKSILSFWLRNNFISTNINKPSEKLFVDLTEGVLNPTPIEERILSLGLKYVITPETVDVREEVTHIGIFANTLKGTINPSTDDNTKLHLKSQINKAINEATDEVLSLRLDQAEIKQNLTKDEKQAVFSLRDREGIMYLKSDKGNRLVVLTENQYDEKMYDIFNDTDVLPCFAKRA